MVGNQTQVHRIMLKMQEFLDTKCKNQRVSAKTLRLLGAVLPKQIPDTATIDGNAVKIIEPDSSNTFPRFVIKKDYPFEWMTV